MVTRYDVISSRWSSHFLKKKSCFLPFLGEKCKKISTKSTKMLNYVVLHVQHKKFPIFNVFWQFLIFGKVQDCAQYGGTLEWHHRPPAARQTIICTSSSRAHHRLSTKGEIVSKYYNITRTQGGSQQTSPPLYHSEGVTLLVHPRIKVARKGYNPYETRKDYKEVFLTM